MRRFLWCLPLASALLAGCDMSEEHNREHRARWRQGMRELHSQIDRYIIDPLTFE